MKLSRIILISGTLLCALQAPWAALALESYFLETRTGLPPARRMIVKNLGSEIQEATYFLSPGQMIRVDATEENLIERARMVKADSGAWLEIAASIDGKDYPLFIYETWKSFSYIDEPFQPIFLNLTKADANAGVTLVAKPEEADWEACRRNSKTCAGWVGSDASVILLDTKLVGSTDGGAGIIQWELLYKISYFRKLKDGSQQSGEGWAQASSFERRLVYPSKLNAMEALQYQTYKSKSKYAADVDSSTAKRVTTQVQEEVLDTMFASQTDRIKNVKFSRWVKPASPTAGLSGESTASAATLLDFRLDYDWRLEYNNFSIVRTGQVPADLAQQGMVFGFSGIAPILLDFEAGGSLTYTHPLSAKGTDGSAGILRFEQFVTRISPSLQNVGAFRWGLGWHLLNQPKISYGFTSLVGVEWVGFLEDRAYYSYFKAGPVFNSEGPNLKSFEFMVGGGWRVDPAQGARSLSVSAELYNLNFVSKLGDTTSARSLSLGLRKSF